MNDYYADAAQYIAKTVGGEGLLQIYGLQDYIAGLWLKLVDLTPVILGSIVVLVVGYVLGRVLGSGVSRVLDKVGVDDAVRKTAIGRALERSGVSVVRFFELIVRWFVYLIAILTAANILNIAVLSSFLASVVQYLPRFIAGVFIIILGIILADFVGDAVKAVGREARAEFSMVLGDALKVFLYLIVIIMGLSVMQIDVRILYVFSTALAWGTALGVGAAIAIAFGLGFKDYVARNAEGWVTSITAKTRQTRAQER
jgi:hypothetical protein